MIKINLKPDLILGDCLEVLKTIPDNSVDSIVTDPPYGISFMAKKWDYEVPSVEVWKECLRILKPGGHALIACGTRTQHRMAVNIEEAGFEIRDVITWLYGSGFPKSMDISKAIDKAAGAERKVIGEKTFADGSKARKTQNLGTGVFNDPESRTSNLTVTAPSTDGAKQWQGWGTALKPACEFWTLARKPLSEKTVAANVLKHGTGAINIDKCRVGSSKRTPGYKNPGGEYSESGEWNQRYSSVQRECDVNQGRWPANLILDEEAAKVLDEQSGFSKGGNRKQQVKTFKGNGVGENIITGLTHSPVDYSDEGGASRFFYVARASKSERNNGLDGLDGLEVHRYGKGLGEGKDPNAPTIDKNHHPTVKPIKLMSYLCKLITPPNGIVLDPFMGSGSTGVAAVKEGFNFIGIEREEQYLEICKARIKSV